MAAGVIKFSILENEYPLTRVAYKMLELAFEIAVAQAHVMAGYAQMLTRVDTGSLRDSIRIEVVPTNSPHKKSVRVRAGGYIVNPKTHRLVDYAGIVEQKYPYMEPAYAMVDESLRGNLENMEESLSE